MSKSVIEDLRRARSRLDEVDAECARRKADIDRLKAEGPGWHFFQDRDRSDRHDGTGACAQGTSPISGREPDNR